MEKSYIRKKSTREPAPDLIIIYTEGTRTEPYYFDGFKLNPVTLKTIGVGMNTKSLIKFIEHDVNKVVTDYAKKHGMHPKEVDYVVWCVFDKDDFKDTNFNAAIRMAESRNYRVAYSNEAFELWYVLHYDYLDAGINREQYCDILCKKLKIQYQKSKQDMYHELIDRQLTAIRNSKRLMKQYPGKSNPAAMKPATKVHELVQYLNQFLR